MCALGEREIDTEGVDVEWNGTRGLPGVGMEQDVAVPSEHDRRRQWLDHADLVVGRHDADEYRLVVKRALDSCNVEPPIGSRPQAGDVDAAALQPPARVEHSTVLGARCSVLIVRM